MKIVVQRVKRASVTNKSIHNQIEKGYCLLVGVGKNSTESDIEVLAKKIINARLFEDDNGKLNLNIQQINGAILSISQFTLYAEVKKVIDQVSQSMRPEDAKILYDKFNSELQKYDIDVQTGEFGTDMEVEIINDGPVTIIYESQDGKVI